MKAANKTVVAVKFLLLIGSVVAFSFLSVALWGGKAEKAPDRREWAFSASMTVSEFGEWNHVPANVLKKTFGLEPQEDLDERLHDLGLSRGEFVSRIDKALALNAEHESKNWRKILAKFALWIAFLTIVFFLMRKRRVTPGMRKGLYLAAVALFGVTLGSDPSPMGTVKDAIVLLGSKGVVFPPRLIAFTVFSIMVVLANKFICAWGCQFGALQDLVFRLNRDSTDRRGLFRQFKIPFVVSNSVRSIFFALFTAVAFLWAFDMVEPIDPFKVYKPQAIAITGVVFIGAVLLASLFVYRPWCSLFCPFGLVGWLLEKLSVFKVKVDYGRCTACESCSRACPSTVMDTILKRDKVIPDCFACGVCLDVCPTGSISFASGKRAKPPDGKFRRDA